MITTQQTEPLGTTLKNKNEYGNNIFFLFRLSSVYLFFLFLFFSFPGTQEYDPQKNEKYGTGYL